MLIAKVADLNSDPLRAEIFRSPVKDTLEDAPESTTTQQPVIISMIN